MALDSNCLIILRFCGSRLWKGHRRKDLSLRHDVWGLNEMIQRLVVIGCLEGWNGVKVHSFMAMVWPGGANSRTTIQSTYGRPFYLWWLPQSMVALGEWGLSQGSSEGQRCVPTHMAKLHCVFWLSLRCQAASFSMPSVSHRSQSQKWVTSPFKFLRRESCTLLLMR